MVWTIQEFIKKIKDMGHEVKYVEFCKFEVRIFGKTKTTAFEFYKLSYSEIDLLPFTPLYEALY